MGASTGQAATDSHFITGPVSVAGSCSSSHLWLSDPTPDLCRRRTSWKSPTEKRRQKLPSGDLGTHALPRREARLQPWRASRQLLVCISPTPLQQDPVTPAPPRCSRPAGALRIPWTPQACLAKDLCWSWEIYQFKRAVNSLSEKPQLLERCEGRTQRAP